MSSVKEKRQGNVEEVEGRLAEVAADRFNLCQELVSNVDGDGIRQHEKVLDYLDQHVPVHLVLLRKALQSHAKPKNPQKTRHSACDFAVPCRLSPLKAIS